MPIGTSTPIDRALGHRDRRDAELTSALEARPDDRGDAIRDRPPVSPAEEHSRRVPLAAAVLARDDLGAVPARALGEDYCM